MLGKIFLNLNTILETICWSKLLLHPVKCNNKVTNQQTKSNSIYHEQTITKYKTIDTNQNSHLKILATKTFPRIQK